MLSLDGRSELAGELLSATITLHVGEREFQMIDSQSETPVPPSSPPTETEVLDTIEQAIRRTTKAYGYQHLSTIATALREQFGVFEPSDYGCKTLLQLIERYPEHFKVKWSAPAHKGLSHVWVRLATEPKRKEGYGEKPAPSPKPKPRLMTVTEFDRLSKWLEAHPGCDGSLRKTRQWLRRRDFLSMEGNTKLLKRLGAHCDCEVLMNVEGKWPEE